MPLAAHEEIFAGFVAGCAVRLPDVERARALSLVVSSKPPPTKRPSHVPRWNDADERPKLMNELILDFTRAQDAIACHPVDVVKTQAHVNKGANVPFVSALVAQARTHGAPSLYRGVLPACLRPQALCMYVGYEWSKKAVSADVKAMTTVEAFGAGWLTAYVESACVTPFETVKVRMQTKENMGRYTSSIQCAGSILRTEGLRGLYAGFWPTCLRNNVFNSCYFGSIHWCKGYLSQPETMAEQALQNVGVGVIAGLVATAFKMPFDILKSRMQGQVPNANGALEYPTMTRAVVQILRSEGPGAFYKGTAVTAARITLGFPVSFVAFEAVASIFEDEIR